MSIAKVNVTLIMYCMKRFNSVYRYTAYFNLVTIAGDERLALIPVIAKQASRLIDSIAIIGFALMDN